jgi:hypothetical protein
MSAVREESGNSDNRVAPRQRVMLAAKLSFNNGSFSTTCTILQLSATGARASIEGDLPVSQRFEISIPQRNVTRMARLVWRRGAMIGLAFEGADGELAGPPPRKPGGNSDGLEEENRRLKVLVAQLEARLKEMKEGY